MKESKVPGGIGTHSYEGQVILSDINFVVYIGLRQQLYWADQGTNLSLV